VDFLDGIHRQAIAAELEDRYRGTEERLAKAMTSLENTVRAFVAAGFLLSWSTYGYLAPVSDETASKARQAMGAELHGGHPGHLGVGENGKRAQRMRADAEAFGTWSRS